MYPSGKSWDEVPGKTSSGKKFHRNVATLSEQQLVDSDTVDPGWDGELMNNAISRADFAFCRDEWQVHGGQLQLHRNKGDLQGSESQRRTRSGKCHGIQRCDHSRRANSDVGSGTATRVYRH